MNLIAAIRREAVYLSHIVRTMLMLARIKPDSTRTIVDIVEAQALATPQAPAIYYMDEVMRYGALNLRANTYAHWALGQGLKRGDCVALFMENRPDFLCCWLGLFKAGLCVALINTNQRGQALAHSIEIVGARHVIAGSEQGLTVQRLLSLDIAVLPYAYLAQHAAYGWASTVDAAQGTRP